MEEERTSIYRRKALRRYLQNQQKIVFLRLVQPKLFRYFWLLLVGLAVVATIAWRTRVPVTIDGVGLVAGLRDSQPARSADLVLLFPPSRLERIRPKQRVLVRNGEAAPTLFGRIEDVEPQVMSPDAIRERFALSGALAAGITGPAAVATARTQAELGGLPAAAFSGARSPVELEVGSRNLLSLVPVLGSLFEEQDPR